MAKAPVSKTPAASHSKTRVEKPQPPAPNSRPPPHYLIQIKPGLFLNADQIVFVRVLPREEGDVYAVMQLSSGDKLDLTRAEFTAISGEQPRQATRLRRKTSSV